MIRWLSRGYALLVALAVLTPVGMALGPRIETRLNPARVHNANLSPTRSLDRVCWVWSSDKLRLAFSDNVDIHLDVLDEAGRPRNTFVPSLYNALTDLPWQSGLSIGLGHHEIPYCIDLPRTVRPDDRLRIRFTPIVHGWLDLWSLPIWTPDIVDPPWAEAPL